MAKELRDILGINTRGKKAHGRHAVGVKRGDAVDIITQIIPIVVGSASEALRISGELFDAGFLVPAIRPPTVPKGTSRLRVSLSAAHDATDIENFAETLMRIRV